METTAISSPIDFTLKPSSSNNNNNNYSSYQRQLCSSPGYNRHSQCASPPRSPCVTASRSPSPDSSPVPSGSLGLLLGKGPGPNSSAFRVVTPKGKNEGKIINYI